MYKVIIAGSRDFDKYEYLRYCCDKILKGIQPSQIEIVSGTARGADKLGEKYAKEKGFKLKRMPAEWKKFGKSAGFKRNAEMAIYGTHLIAFWDGKSRGTKNMINIARKNQVVVKVVEYKKLSIDL